MEIEKEQPLSEAEMGMCRILFDILDPYQM